MFKKVSSLFILSIAALNLNAQNSDKSFSELNFQPHIGLSWQSTFFKPVFDFSYIPELAVSYFPYNFERNTQGFGADLGFTLSANISERFQIGIKANGRFRYDYIYGKIEGSPEYSDEVKSFLFDYSTAFVFIYNSRKRPDKDWMAGLGFTGNNMGKQEFLDVQYNNQVLSLQFDYHYVSYNLSLSYDILQISKKFYLNTGIVVNYIPKDFPGYPFRSFMTAGITADIRFKPPKFILSSKK